MVCRILRLYAIDHLPYTIYDTPYHILIHHIGIPMFMWSLGPLSFLMTSSLCFEVVWVLTCADLGSQKLQQAWPRPMSESTRVTHALCLRTHTHIYSSTYMYTQYVPVFTCMYIPIHIVVDLRSLQIKR